MQFRLDRQERSGLELRFSTLRYAAVTGFVSEQAGSVASANALLLRELLLRGHEVHFFSKASYAPTDLEDTVELRAAAIRLGLTEHMVLADRTAAWLHGVDHYRIEDRSPTACHRSM